MTPSVFLESDDEEFIKRSTTTPACHVTSLPLQSLDGLGAKEVKPQRETFSLNVTGMFL